MTATKEFVEKEIKACSSPTSIARTATMPKLDENLSTLFTAYEMDQREDGSALQEYMQEKTGPRTVTNIFIAENTENLEHTTNIIMPISKIFAKIIRKLTPLSARERWFRREVERGLVYDSTLELEQNQGLTDEQGVTINDEPVVAKKEKKERRSVNDKFRRALRFKWSPPKKVAAAADKKGVPPVNDSFTLPSAISQQQQHDGNHIRHCPTTNVHFFAPDAYINLHAPDATHHHQSHSLPAGETLIQHHYTVEGVLDQVHTQVVDAHEHLDMEMVGPHMVVFSLD
ncbi:hypothetical protein DFS34DRAFT_693398 [Phlyctochytrium arcticum]|nr:hypothetical protein DFS34DRAFT_693398 [Phlyctochytrium arcticum]